MADYTLRSPVDGKGPAIEYTDDDKPTDRTDDEEDGDTDRTDDEGPPLREKPIHKQIHEFKSFVLAQNSEIDWEHVWKTFDLIDDRQGHGQSEVDDRTALHVLVSEYNQAEGTNKDQSQASIKAIANVTKRYPGLVSRLDKSGKTPLYDAISVRHARVVRNMVKHCGTRMTKPPGEDHPLVQAIQKPCDYKTGKENALHIAFREMHRAVDRETLKTMCEYATQEAVSAADVDGFTPLHYAVRYRHSSQGQFEMIKIMLDKGQVKREDPESCVRDVLDQYASIKVGNRVDRMSVFEYHKYTRESYGQDASSSSISRARRPGKAGDTGKAGKHNDKRREVEQATSTTDSKRLTAGTVAQATVQASTSRPDGEQGRRERIPERTKDERTGRGPRPESTAQGGKSSKDKDSQEKDEKVDSGKQASQAKADKQGGHRLVDGQKLESIKEAAPANIGITRTNTGAPALSRPRAIESQETAEEKKKRRDEWSDRIQNELKIQILRNRPFEKATRFLYNKNLKNSSFADVQFESVLKYVAFPHVVVQGWRKNAENPLRDVGEVSETEAQLRGRTDMLFFFEWLREKHVKRILKVIVDDMHPDKPPHSDEAIERCLKGMGVEELAWQKKDLDPDTICRIDGFGDDQDDQRRAELIEEDSDDEDDSMKNANDETHLTGTLRILHLWWNGDNAVLRGWSDPDGIRRQLPELRRVHVTTRKSLESKERTERNIQAFKIRMEAHYDHPQADLRKASVTVDATGEADEKLSDPSRKAKQIRFEEPMPEQAMPRRPIEVIHAQVGRATGAQVHSNSSEVDVSIRPSHRWLIATDDFGAKVAPVWKKLLIERERERRGPKPKDIVVALIDDGVDNTHLPLKDKIIPGRTLSSDNDRIRPWYVSEKGHGTLMATSICRVCPMAKIYPIRLHTTGAANSWQSSIDPESAIKAIESAVDMNVDIISLSWTIKVPPDSMRERFKAAIERASNNNILVFCSAADRGHISGQYYPSALGSEFFIRVGAARADGLPYEKVGDLNDVDFIMPGVDVIPPEISAGLSQEVKDRSVTGSSVAAALGSGLAAMMLYCLYIGELSGKEGINEKERMDLKATATMKKAIKWFGTSESKGSDHKFVEVFHKLEKMSQELSPATIPDTARGSIAKLARDFITRSS
ncbi:hypothetical protein NLU13_0051 [Sarocladium strictum]|uniref:Peptidase S8/S53 domain-containing protein n=1 Tax=Sarocladium strictum TaxID=5046 RepID=A0AA39GND9_SARSR|nr:hypothetical protein NLU13_0051 [Sarocladium strictum]